MSIQRSEFRRDDVTRTKCLNTENPNSALNTIPDRLTVLRFGVWHHEGSNK